jgi:hypothetical protein
MNEHDHDPDDLKLPFLFVPAGQTARPEDLADFADPVFLPANLVLQPQPAAADEDSRTGKPADGPVPG